MPIPNPIPVWINYSHKEIGYALKDIIANIVDFKDMDNYPSISLLFTMSIRELPVD